MYWLIETKDQLEELYNSNFKDVFIEIIPHSNIVHPAENQICALYLRPLNSTKGYITPITHSETLSLDINDIERVLNTVKNIYVRDKKEFLHYFTFKNILDITLTHPPYIQEYTQTHSFFYKNHPDKADINRIIPIVKHYEYCEKTFEDLKSRINEPINNFYNNKTTLVFNAIERGGIRIDKTKFESHFHPTTSEHVYTQFNFKTTTTRPSSNFGGVNYAALDKNNGSRQSFIPSNDLFIEMDISAYHPTLLAKLVGYDFGEDDIHQSFAKMYGVDYQKAKELTFKQLYGGVFKQYEDLEFFKKVKKYTDELWATFQNVGSIECPISKHIYYKDKLVDMNPQKLLNYLLQNMETSYNVCMLWDILKLLNGFNTKIVLYTYDSILLDVDKNERDVIKGVKNVFKKNNLNIKLEVGDNYGEMVRV